MKRQNHKRNRWEDHYSQKAKKDRFPARSVYKLQEIQKKTHLIKKGNRILDLGCFPGSWLLYAAELVGKEGRIIGIDLKPVRLKLPDHVSAYTGDIMNMDESLEAIIGENFNVVLSDMAPSTSGNKWLDTVRSYELSSSALDIAERLLVRGGSFVCKIFQGEDFKEFTDAVKNQFDQFKIFKPQSSRKASRETFVIGIGKK